MFRLVNYDIYKDVPPKAGYRQYIQGASCDASPDTNENKARYDSM